MGDFNIDYQNGNFSNNDLQQLVNFPTRITAYSETTIDHIYTSTPDNIADVTVQIISLSDHYPVSFTREATKINLKDTNTSQYSIDATKDLTKRDSLTIFQHN